MSNELLSFIATQGLFGLLFCLLLFYVLKENTRREEHYQNVIHNLSESMSFREKDVKMQNKNIRP